MVYFPPIILIMLVPAAKKYRPHGNPAQIVISILILAVQKCIKYLRQNNSEGRIMIYKKKVFSLFVLICFSFPGCITMMVDSFTGEDVATEIRANGLPATATVIKIWETGVKVNNNPVVGFLLEVHAEGMEPYQAETKALISILNIPQIQPGAVLKVKYDPEDPNRVVLDTREE